VAEPTRAHSRNAGRRRLSVCGLLQAAARPASALVPHVAAVIACAARLSAQAVTGAAIAGRVVTTDSTPLDQAIVRVTNTSNGERWQTTTGEACPPNPDLFREVIERENDADEITRAVLKTVRETFLTPFDRGTITSLIGSMDDAIDEMQAAVQAIDLYEVREFEQEMKDMAGIIVDAARLTAEAMPLLRDVGRNAGRLHELTERLVRMEGHADDIHRAGVKRGFVEYGRDDTLRFIVAREVYKHLERIVDAFEDVANEIDGIVIDHA